MVTVIRKLTGGTHPFYEYACLSTDVKPVSLVPENSLCREIDIGKKFYFSDGAWHEAPGRGGGEGGELPENFPAEGSENANKYIGFDTDGYYAAKNAPSGGGGGAEKFIVTLTQDAQTEEWTADKTVAEIAAAYDDGQIVESTAEVAAGVTIKFSAVGHVVQEGQEVIAFSAVAAIESTKYTMFGAMGVHIASDDIDIWEISTVNTPNIPEYSARDDAGKILGVGDMGLAWVDNYAPLIVTMTAGQTEGTLVGDKTYKEAFDAMQLGIPVSAVIQGMAATRVIDAVLAESNYYLTYSSIESGTPTLAVLTGSANEYISLTVGG